MMVISCTKREAPVPVEGRDSSSSTGTTIKGSDYPATIAIKPGEAPFQIYKLHSGQPRNLSFSPLSLKMAFEMLYPVAGENARLALEKGFGFSSKETDRFKSERDLASRLNAMKDKNTRLRIGNSVWVKNPKALNPSYLSTLSSLSAEANPLGLKEMNDWVRNTTDGRIPSILDRLDPGTLFVAINALYFKGEWTFPFKKEQTMVGNFRSSESSVIATDMMRQVHGFKYFEDDDSKWLELPYKDSPFSMILALPRKDFETKKLDSKLDSASVSDILTKMKEEQVELVLPKFKVSEKSSLKDDLSLSGYGSLFSPGEWKAVSNQLEFHLSDVIQAVSLEVDEQGTITAAATALTIESTSLNFKSKKAFYCDHPFVYLLMNRESGEIYFMGRVYKPE